MRALHITITGVLVLLALAATPRLAAACSCVAGAPICETFWKTDVVFSGEVIDVSPTPNPVGEGYPPHRRVRFRVFQSWRGSVGTTVEVNTGAGGGDCGYNFHKGVSYLVYAHNRGESLTTGICSRTQPLTTAAEDLEYFKSALRPSATGRIFGLVRYQRNPHDPAQPLRPIANYEVELSSERETRSAKTDVNGRYEFSGVPPGTYALRAKIPPGEHAFGPGTVTLADPRGCAAGDFFVVPDGRISVRLHDAAAGPIAGAVLDVIDLDTVVGGRPLTAVTSVQTDATGLVEFRQLRPGRYVVAMNAARPPGTRQPYPTTFFAGVPTLAEARTIELGLGERVHLGEWNLPNRLHERRVTGRVLLPDGTPAAGAHVYVIGARNGGWAFRQVDGANATTTADGSFTLVLHDGIAYEIRAFLNVSESQQLNAAMPDFTAGTSTAPLQLLLKRSR